MKEIREFTEDETEDIKVDGTKYELLAIDMTTTFVYGDSKSGYHHYTLPRLYATDFLLIYKKKKLVYFGFLSDFLISDDRTLRSIGKKIKKIEEEEMNTPEKIREKFNTN